MKTKSFLLLATLLAFHPALIAAEAAPGAATATLQGDAARPAAAQWLRRELYFATGLADAPESGLTEAQWRAFLDREVTARFPDGLTVFEAYGQWQNRAKATVGRLRTKVLVILHEDTPQTRAAIDAIRVAWKSATHDQSVLLVTERVEVSF